MPSVTDLHLCHLCPRLLYFCYLERRDKKKSECGVRHAGNKGGKLQGQFVLHPILESVHTDLSGCGNNEIRDELIDALGSPDRERQFRSVVMKHYFKKIMENINMDGIFPLQDALKIWEEELFGCFDRGMIFQRSQNTLSSEHEQIGKISGEPDAVLFDPKEMEYVIWEFKGLKEARSERTSMQVALYAWLLEKETGIRTSRATVFVFENEKPIRHYYRNEIDSNLQKIEDELCKMYNNVLDAVNDDKHGMGNLHKLDRARDLSVCEMVKCEKRDICRNSMMLS